MTILLQRVFEAVLFGAVVQAGVSLRESAGWSEDEGLRGLLRRNPFPVTALAVTAALGAGVVAELVWSGALDQLRQQPGSGQWWRSLTAPFVQDGGAAGVIFNLVSAAILIALVEWQYGRLCAVAVWLVGAWAPLGELAHLAGYHVASADAHAYGAGSSGATYFAAATLCAARLTTGPVRARALGLLAPAIAVTMWLTVDDGHGVLFCEGALAGGLVVVGERLTQLGSPTLRRQSQQFHWATTGCSSDQVPTPT